MAPVKVESEGVTWLVQADDFVWAASEVCKDADVSYQSGIGSDEFKRRVVALCHGWGRRIVESLG